MRWKSHVRFGGRARETHQSKGWQGALVRPNTRIVINADGVPVDLGRTQRLYTRAQRRAVIARDRHCAWPDCAKPARWCQIHHLNWWERDFGVTSLENAVLLCSFHHHEAHRRDLIITRIGAGHSPGRGTRSRAGGAALPAAGANHTIALATYEFHDRAGHEIRETRGDPPPPDRPPATPRPGPPPAPAFDGAMLFDG